jgi:hypothetical protein
MTMRVLWALIGLLILGTAVVVVSGRVRADGGSRSSSQASPESAGMVAMQTPTPASSRTEAPVQKPVEKPVETPVQKPVQAPIEAPVVSNPDPKPEPVASDPVSAEPETVDPQVDPQTDPQADPVVPVDDTPTTADDTNTTAVPDDDAATDLATELVESSEQRRDEPDAEESTEQALNVDEDDAAAAAAPDAPTEAKIVQQPDGSMLIDDRFIVSGAGTEKDPYRITWEMLVSANETYRPRLGKTELPARIKMLDGKHVKITGYLAFPLAAQEIEEALVMLNQWDGCCIGVPPSPYDALETRLSEPLKFDKGHVFQYGTASGRLKIDPYLVNNWLVGLYLLEDASIEMDL